MGNGDFNKPSGSVIRAVYMADITDMFATLAKMSGLAANPPDQHIRYNSSTKRFEKYATATGLWTALDTTGGSQFVAGTRLLFQQSAAPTGWTKETDAAYNDAALRVVTGSVATGGASAFSAVFNQNQNVTLSMGGVAVTVDSHVLTIAEMPSHTHTYDLLVDRFGLNSSTTPFQVKQGSITTTGSAGGGAGHSHIGSGTVTGSGSFTQPNLKYCDIIIATKD
jgi:hypothetical protein